MNDNNCTLKTLACIFKLRSSTLHHLCIAIILFTIARQERPIVNGGGLGGSSDAMNPTVQHYFCLEDMPTKRIKPLVRDCSCRGDSAGFAHLPCLTKSSIVLTNENTLGS